MSIDTFLIVLGSFTFGWFFRAAIQWARKDSSPKTNPKVVMARPKRLA